jgi:hypothetical protein
MIEMPCSFWADVEIFLHSLVLMLAMGFFIVNQCIRMADSLSGD